MEHTDYTSQFLGQSFASVRRRVKNIFSDAGIDSADIDGRLLLTLATGYSHLKIVTRSDDILTRDAASRLNLYCQRRLKGEPVDKILGYKEFYGRKFTVTTDVLSPRPETEGVVEAALRFVQDIQTPHILDLGTGSGAILISLLCELQDATGIGTDISPAALHVARGNAELYDVSKRLSFLCGSWFEPLDWSQAFDLIISNPPYITHAAMAHLPKDVMDYDPRLALYGGQDGLEAYRAIIKSAAFYLKSNRYLIFEIGFDQGAVVSDLLSSSGYKNVSVSQDLSGHDRYVYGCRV